MKTRAAVAFEAGKLLEVVEVDNVPKYGVLKNTLWVIINSFYQR